MKLAPNLILVGPMGAGKSCIGHHLTAHTGLRLVDLDDEIERRAGGNISAIFEHEGEAGFRRREHLALVDLLVVAGPSDSLLIATGGGAVLDADNRRLLRKRGFVVHLHAEPATQLARLAGDTSRPLLQCDDRDTLLRELAEQRAPLYAEVADLRFATDGLDAMEAAAQLAGQLLLHWQRGVPA
ncbi:MAG TPA: shikimate kinase [Lysobacter sp.]|nr:shikimate kinase [Lysobacter sp.]